ncbi:MAG: choice-of-anchor I family protein [Planctomycetota bacterium]
MTIRILALAAALAATASLSAQISHTHLSTIQSTNQEGEIVAYDAGSGRYFVTNPGSDELDVFTSSATGQLSLIGSIPLAGAPNSVAVYNGLVAVAVEGPTKQDLGQVQFFDAATGAVSGASVTVGPLPDMLAFTPDGSKVLTANEGEADEATGLNNPEGSISVVDVASRTAQTASFVPFNAQKAALQAAGVRLSDVNGITLAQDVEPEYLTINAAGTTAYCTLQENNAIAVVDIATVTVTDIFPLGEKDHNLPGNAFDPSNDDGIDGNFLNFPILGYYMPDAITSFTVGGVEYIATANEGDGRDDFAGFGDETRGDDLEDGFTLDTEDPTPETGLYSSADLNDDAILGRLKFVTSDYDIARGDTDNDGDVDQLYSFGARSFTIWDTGGNLVFDSGDEFERTMLARGLWEDGRSDDKGPEPESIVFGEVNGLPLLFIGLERTNSVLVYSVQNPNNPILRDVIDVAGESGIGAEAPEGLQFIPASESSTGTPLLAVTSEGDGAISLFSIDYIPGQIFSEVADAGELPGTADVTTGAGAIAEIRGTLDSANDVDMFLVNVFDVASFSASTVGGAAFDTQMWMFKPDGTGIAFRDDDPGTLRSTLTGQFLTGPGPVLIAVSRYNNDAQDANGDNLWTNGPFEVERQPDGPGAANPIASWNGSGFGSAGAYTIYLGGAEFAAAEPECFLFIGLQEGALPFGPEVDDVLRVAPILIYPVSTSNIPVLPIPNDTNLIGSTVSAQVGMNNPIVFPSNPLQLSNGWRLVLGLGTQTFGQDMSSSTTGIVLGGDFIPALGADYTFDFVIL